VTPTRSVETVSDTLFERGLRSWPDRHPYTVNLAMIAAVTALGFATGPVLRPTNLNILYLLVVLVSALKWGQRPAIFAAIASALVFDYCFIQPYFSFAITDLAYLVTLLGFVAVAVVTSRLAARAHRVILEHAARERAEARNKAKDEVLHKISHELRSPLTALVGWTQLLGLSELNREQISHSLSGLDHSVQLLRRLVEDLWDASGAGSGKLRVHLQPTALSPCVAKALDVVVGAAKQKCIHLDSGIESVGEVLADEVRIQQIVTNLVSNAIKFTPAEGKIVVRLSRDGEEARLIVSDTGIGIPNEFLPQLFDPFTQADPKNSHGGLGLGLSIVKYLVQAHNGRISVRSDGEGRGTTFIVCLPVTAVHQVTIDHSIVTAA
jgi:signal transduction histidine kinase